MRLPFLPTAILIAGTVMSGPVPASDAKVPDPATAAAAIRQLNQEYIDAARAGDAGWFRKHMAENVLVIFGSGSRLDKAAFLAGFDTPTHYKSLTVRNVTVRVFGPVAQVDADAPWELADGRKGVSRYIDTYAWLDGRWQVISAQITWLPEASGS